MLNDNNARYLYSVYPRKLIRNLSEDIPFIRVPKSYYLNKDEVKKCISFSASIFRRFTNEDKIEKVTLINIDRLHNDVFYSEKEYENLCKLSKEKTEPIVNDEVISEVVNEVTTEEVENEEIETVEESISNNEEEIIEKSIIEDNEIVENEIIEDESIEDETPVIEETKEDKKQKYHNNKKHYNIKYNKKK